MTGDELRPGEAQLLAMGFTRGEVSRLLAWGAREPRGMLTPPTPLNRAQRRALDRARRRRKA